MTAVVDRPVPEPGSPAWQRLMSASKVPAALGVSPWASPFTLWHEMTGRVVRDTEPTTVQRRGHYLEPGVLQWWWHEHGAGSHELATQEVRWLDGWGIATLDGLAHLDDGGTVVVEVKTTNSWDAWGDPDTDQVPVYYLAQVLWQLALTPSASRAEIAVLGPRLDFRRYIIEREQYADDIAATVRAARTFYDSLTDPEPPPLSAPWPPTIATLRALHPDIDRGAVAVVDPDLAYRFVQTDITMKNAEAARDEAKAAILAAAGTAQHIETPAGVRIARRQGGQRGSVSLIRVAKEAPE